jgi:hypothetical protein
LTSGLADDASKEQIDSARDILDRVGVRKDIQPAGPSPDSVISDVAYGAFRALLSKFGVDMPVLHAVDPADEALNVSVSPSVGTLSVVQGLLGTAPMLPATPEGIASPAPRSTRRRAPKTDDFLVNLEEKNVREDEKTHSNGRFRAQRPAKGRKTVDGRGLA